jgi:uncharacterized phage protein (TIGR02216 family)
MTTAHSRAVLASEASGQRGYCRFAAPDTRADPRSSARRSGNPINSGSPLSQGRAEVVAFPWEHALAIGLGILRLPPEQFWKMTPREFAAALRGLYGDAPAPIDRETFAALADRFPDRRTK